MNEAITEATTTESTTIEETMTEATMTEATIAEATTTALPPWRACIDVGRLKADLRRLAEAIRALKREIRATPTPWPRPMAAELRALKGRATLLCAIQAHRRGRLHLRRCVRAHAYLGLPQTERFTLQLQARFIGERWRDYQLPVVEPQEGGG